MIGPRLYRYPAAFYGAACINRGYRRERREAGIYTLEVTAREAVAFGAKEW